MKIKRSTSILMLIMSVAIVCLSFGMFSFKFSKNSQALKEEVANAVSADGGAMYIGAGSKVTLGSDCTISGIKGATNGGAIYVAGELTIDGATISDCASVYGGAIYVANTGKVTMNSGTISECLASSEGGAIFSQGGTVNINGGTISSCSAANFGGGISSWGGTVNVSDGSFNSNSTGYYDGGAIYVEGATLNVSGGEFDGNTAQEGSAIQCYGSAISIIGTSENYIEFCNNKSTGDYGGAISFYDEEMQPSCAGISYCNFTTNTAVNGSSISFEFTGDFDYPISNCYFDTEIASGCGGAIYIFDDGYGATIEITNCDFDYCEATIGGAIYNDGGINSIEISGCWFGRNRSSENGGAIYAEETTIYATEFNQNTTLGSGGAIYAYGNIYIHGDVEFQMCSSEGQDGGGAIYIASGTTDINCYEGNSNLINSCDAVEGNGGGIFVSSNGVLNCDQEAYLTISNCTATSSGGGIYYDSQVTSMRLYETTINNCSTLDGGEAGGGVFIGDGLDIECIGLQIYECESSLGGGIFADTNTSFDISSSEIYSNTSDSGQGANIQVYGGGQANGYYIFRYGAEIYSPVTGYNIFTCDDYAAVTINSGAIIGTANPASNDRIVLYGQSDMLVLNGGTIYSILEGGGQESILFNFNPTNTITVDRYCYVNFSSTSYIDISDFKADTSGYVATLSPDGTYIYFKVSTTISIDFRNGTEDRVSINLPSGTIKSIDSGGSYSYNGVSGSFTFTCYNFSNNYKIEVYSDQGGILGYVYSNSSAAYGYGSATFTLTRSDHIDFTMVSASAALPDGINDIPEKNIEESLFYAPNADEYYAPEKNIQTNMSLSSNLSINDEEKYVVKANRLKIA